LSYWRRAILSSEFLSSEGKNRHSALSTQHSALPYFPLTFMQLMRLCARQNFFNSTFCTPASDFDLCAIVRSLQRGLAARRFSASLA